MLVLFHWFSVGGCGFEPFSISWPSRRAWGPPISEDEPTLTSSDPPPPHYLLPQEEDALPASTGVFSADRACPLTSQAWSFLGHLREVNGLSPCRSRETIRELHGQRPLRGMNDSTSWFFWLGMMLTSVVPLRFGTLQEPRVKRIRSLLTRFGSTVFTHSV